MDVEPQLFWMAIWMPVMGDKSKAEELITYRNLLPSSSSLRIKFVTQASEGGSLCV